MFVPLIHSGRFKGITREFRLIAVLATSPDVANTRRGSRNASDDELSTSHARRWRRNAVITSASDGRGGLGDVQLDIARSPGVGGAHERGGGAGGEKDECLAAQAVEGLSEQREGRFLIGADTGADHRA